MVAYSIERATEFEMTMSITTITFLVGLALIVVAILGGGIELKEVKVANLSRLNRLLSFVVGAALVFVCVRHPEIIEGTNSGNKSSPPKTETADAQGRSIAPSEILTVHFTNELGIEQISENVEVSIDGAFIGRLKVDKSKERAVLPFQTVKSTIAYSLSGVQVRNEGGLNVQEKLVGGGSINLVDGASYAVGIMREGKGKKFTFNPD